MKGSYRQEQFERLDAKSACDNHRNIKFTNPKLLMLAFKGNTNTQSPNCS